MSVEEVSVQSGRRIFLDRRGATLLDVQPDFLEMLPVAIYACDAQGRLLWFNSRAVEIWGRTPRVGDDFEEFCGASGLYISGSQLSPHQSPMLEVLRTGVPTSAVEGQLARRDGSTLRVRMHIEPVRDSNGRVIAAINCVHESPAAYVAAESAARRADEWAALRDFTERVQHASTSNELYDLAMTALMRAIHCQRAAILLFDPAGVMRCVASRGLSDAYGRAAEGHSPWKIDGRDAQPVYINEVNRSDLPEALKETLRAEGIGALVFIPVREDGALIGKLVAYRDAPQAFVASEGEVGLTIARQLVFALERKRAEEATRWLASIVESSDDAIISKNLDGIILTWNAGAERIFGYKPEEVVGKSITILIPPDRPDEEPGILARLRRGERIDHYETVRRHKDGSLIDISLTVSPLRDRSGRVVGASKIARDISERKQAETQQRLLLRELNHRVKNNMQMLQSLLHAATRQTRSLEARKVLDNAVGRIAAMAAAQRVLYNTRNATRFKIDEFLTAVCQTAQLSFPPSIKIECEAASGELDNDFAMPLALILNELLTNAAKHGCHGEGEKVIRVGFTNAEDGTVLYVEDGGPGFDLQAVNGHASGLKLVQLLARQLRGSVEVVRKPVSRCSVRFK